MDWSNPLVYLAAGGILVTIGIWVGSMNTFKGTVGETLTEIKESISKIEDRIVDIFEKIGPSTTGTNSPISLTDLGRTVSGELDAADWAKVKSTELLPQLRGKSPYEIQDFCFEYVKHGQFDPSPDLYQRAQNSAYQHGLTIDQVFRVFAIELRDIILGKLELDVPD